MKGGKKEEREETPGTALGYFFFRTFAYLLQEGREEPKWQDFYGSSRSPSRPHILIPPSGCGMESSVPRPPPMTVGTGSLQFHCGLKVELPPSCGILALSREAFSFSVVQRQPP